MSQLSDAVKAFVLAESAAATLESTQRDLEQQISVARTERDKTKDAMEKVFMESGDRSISVPVDAGTIVIFLRRGDSYCQVDILPVDAAADFDVVPKSNKVIS